MKFLGLLIPFVLISACGDKICKQDDTFSGIVIEQYDFFGNALDGFVDVGQYVILTDSVYRNAFKDSTFDIPAIDFSEYSLLGQYASGSCKVSYNKNVDVNTENKTYTYTLTQYECNTFYDKLCYSDNWILVPKLPSNWTVVFNIVNR